PDMHARPQPRGVVQGPGLEVAVLRQAGRRVVQPGPARAAEPAQHGAPAVAGAGEVYGLAARNAEMLMRHDRGHGEGCAGLALALPAMTGVDHGRCGRDLIANAAALASAGL